MAKFTITNEQTNSLGETLLQTKETTYAHFRAYVDSQDPDLPKEKKAKLRELFGDAGVPPCPVGSPMTMIIPKPTPDNSKRSKIYDKLPAIAARAVDWSTSKLNERITQRRRQQAVFGLVSKDSNLAGAGTIQGFGGALNEDTALSPEEMQIKLAELQARDFVLDGIGKGARLWTQDRVIDAYLKQQLALTGSKREYLGPIKDPRGNYYVLSADHSDKTLEQLHELHNQQRAGQSTKFAKLVALPIDGRAASIMMALENQTPRLYVGPGLDRVRDRMLGRQVDHVLEVAERIGQARETIANTKENWLQSRSAALESGKSSRMAALSATRKLLRTSAEQAGAKIGKKLENMKKGGLESVWGGKIASKLRDNNERDEVSK